MVGDKLPYRLTNDACCKLYFVENPHLLEQLTALILHSGQQKFQQFVILNPELTAPILSDKFCRLDIHMMADNQNVDLEVQVKNEGDFRERSAFYLSRVFGLSLAQGEEYKNIQPAVGINILDFNLFKHPEYRSDYIFMNTERFTPLTNSLKLIYLELKKVPKMPSPDDSLAQWLRLFAAKTYADLKLISKLGGIEMKEPVEALVEIINNPTNRDLLRMRLDARDNKVLAISKAIMKNDTKWTMKMAEKDNMIAEKDNMLMEKDNILTEKDNMIAEMQKEILRLREKK